VSPDLPGYVGFANLPNQVHRKSVKKGFEFTLMVVGKSSLLTSTVGFYPGWGVSVGIPGIRVLVPSRILHIEGDCDSGHVLLLDRTLTLVVRGFGRCIQFLSVMLPQACPVINATLLVHYCAPFITRI